MLSSVQLYAAVLSSVQQCSAVPSSAQKCSAVLKNHYFSVSEWSTDLYSDAANLLASDAGDVVSAGLNGIQLFFFVTDDLDKASVPGLLASLYSKGLYLVIRPEPTTLDTLVETLS